ncbi:MAG TPA: glycosyltransferase [Candidatus Didemnitutus sp.]|nr:glycosyltransferase [Candidatus Didemnitutus sp.]
MAAPLHVCILCTQHSPDDGRVTHKLGAMLAHAGFPVTWVGPGAPGSVRVPGIEFHPFASFGRGRWSRLLLWRKLERTCLAIPGIEKTAVFLAVEPDSAEVAIRLGRRFGARAIFDIHEIYHGEMLQYWVPAWLQPLASRVVLARLRSICRRADLVMGPGTTRIDPYRAVARRTLVVRHSLGLSAMQGNEARPLPDGTPMVRIMHGKAAPSRGTETLLRGAARAAELLDGRTVFKVVCFEGPGGAEAARNRPFRAFIEREKLLPLVDLRAQVPFSEMMPILATCDIGAIAYGRDFGVRSLPNRIFEYMAVGLPVIVPDYAAELRPILSRFQCGVEADMEDEESIAMAIIRLVTDRAAARAMGRRGREASLLELNMEQEIAPLIAWIGGRTEAST